MRIFNYFVYIIKCSDNSYYTGVTNDLERRLHEHNHSNDHSAYTFDKRPTILMYYEPFYDINRAIAFEKQIKGWTRKKKEALINKNWDRIKELAICNNGSSHKNYRKTGTPFDSAQGDSNNDGNNLYNA